MSNDFWPDNAQYLGNTPQPQQSVDLTKVAELMPDSRQDTSFGFNDTQPTTQPKTAAKVRSRLPTGQQQVKHRRTRSGCYTCRSRRVKCDEARPTCERCRKGSRQCTYPEPRPSTKPVSNLGHLKEATEPDVESSDEYDDEEQQHKIDLAPSDEHPAVEQYQRRVPTARRHSPARSDMLSQTQSSRSGKSAFSTKDPTDDCKDKSLSPSTDNSSIYSTNSPAAIVQQSDNLSHVSATTSQDSVPWSHLPLDLQRHLEYHHQLTYHHWFFRYDTTHFLRLILVENALAYDPLLYAVAGFAAFQKTLKTHTGKIQDFLGYYNKSVTLLRKSLADGQKHTDATLLTILQLATFEEYLGDWVNLLGHQRAAYGILLELYSPEVIMQTEIQRHILSWYARFDLYAGLMAGHETVLGRDWFCANDDYYRSQMLLYPDNLELKIESAVASHRLMAMDMAMLFAKLPRGEISLADFSVDNKLIAERISTCWSPLAPLLSDKKYLVTSFDGAPDHDINDIVDPYMAGGLYGGDLWIANFIILDWTAIEMMHKYQTALLLRQEPPPEVQTLALNICRRFEAIEHSPQSPPEAILSAHGSIGLATLHVPKDENHVMWCRQKLAKVEGMGYIYPPTFRSKMAELWGLPELRHWWLPNDEGYPPIVRSIRAFIEDRTQPRPQAQSEDVRNMKAIFSKMSIESRPESAINPASLAANCSGGGLEHERSKAN